MGAKKTWAPSVMAHEDERESYDYVVDALANSKYSQTGIRRIDGALRALLQVSGKQPHVLVARLRKLEARPVVEPRKRPVKGAEEE